ncbi:MAG: hypothetical protein ISF22_04375 [Methanomassiliicoccus sp.]|nr:hypothetical protein [Methanomassiliicoccus sp.]
MMETQQKQRVMGPVDFLVVRFPENRFTGKIAPEIRKLEDSGIVRVIDLVFIRKDQEGNVESFEISDLGGEDENAFQTFSGKVGEWLSQEDIESIGSELPDNSSAGAILFENLWAVNLKEAMLDSGGELVAQGRVSPDLIEQVRKKNEPSRSG